MGIKEEEAEEGGWVGHCDHDCLKMVGGSWLMARGCLVAGRMVHVSWFMAHGSTIPLCISSG